MDEATHSPSPTGDVLAEVLAWRQAHPAATFADLEDAVEAQLDRVRAQVLEQAAVLPSTAPRPVCPQCAGAVQARGERERRLTVSGDQVVRLRRPYYWCLACAAGFFPPR